jgi:hypothetical protein
MNLSKAFPRLPHYFQTIHPLFFLKRGFSEGVVQEKDFPLRRYNE